MTGGVCGVSAHVAEAIGLAHRFEASADRQQEWAVRSRRVASDPDLLESGLLAPASCAAAEAAVLETVLALKTDATAWQACAWAVRLAIGLLDEADAVARADLDAIDYQVGRLLGFTAVRMPWLVGWTLLSLDRLDLLHDTTLTDHPTLFTHLMNGSGGVLDGLAAGLGLPLLLTPRVSDAARLAAATYGDEGRPLVRPVGVVVPGGDRQAGSVRDLVAHLEQVAELSSSPDSALNGTIEVQTIRGADGEVRHVVYLPGTDDLTTTPWSQDQDVRDMATNTQLMAGQDDTYQRGILAALHDAGVRPGEPVALVGHSQGGMEAVALLAHHSAAAGDPGAPDITDVVTAGSPTAQVSHLPAGSQVLSLEQRGDIVPELDGRAPLDSVQQTTATFDARPDGGVLAHHGYPTYVAGAGAADASTDPSVQSSIATLRDHGFLSGGAGAGPGVQVSTQIFQITRG